jgi:hypothetical protein
MSVISVNIYGAGSNDFRPSTTTSSILPTSKAYVDQQISIVNANISSKVSKTYVDQQLSTVNVDVSSKVDKTYVDDQIDIIKTDISSKVDKAYVDQQLSTANADIPNRDVATKKFVTRRTLKNNVGLVPILTSNLNNKSGYKVTASSEYDTNHSACNVFNSLTDNDWCTAGVDSEFWIQLQCPEVIKIHKFTIRGRNNQGIERIFRWKLQGSNNNNDWDELHNGNNEYINYDFKVVDVKPTTGYLYYRIWVDRAEGGNPGLSHWQIYSLDSII